MKRSSLRLAGIFLAFFCVLCISAASSASFVPEQRVMPVSRLRAGMQGYMLTVMKGTKPVRLPIEIVSVIPQKGSLKNAIMIRVLPSAENKIGGVAQGMSGSPVYVDDRLIGAVGIGWNFSDHKTALVTPIEEMCDIFSRPDRPISLPGIDLRPVSGEPSFRSTPLMVGGLSGHVADGLGAYLGIPVQTSPYGAAGDLPVEGSKFSPGDAVAVLLAWGDVEMAATGTVTATSKDGRFLAFGHPFLERGAVNFPVARARIHDTIFSQLFPFKLASPISLAGTVTQDRAAGIGGRMGYFTPAISATLIFRDLDVSDGRTNRSVKNFRVVPDAFLGAKLLGSIYGGLLEDQWGRKGQGTATATMRVEGNGLTQGWARTNVFFSDEDVGTAVMKEYTSIMEMFLLQPFKNIYPIGFRLDVSITQEPKVLLIEDVSVSSDAKPGDTLGVDVTLRPWRRNPVKKHFEVTIPKDATGSCELIVRGGGVNPLPQLGVEGGWKSINSLDRMLTELNAADSNNELIVELLHDEAGNKTAQGGKKATAELLPEEKEFLSETKARRIKEGTLCISRSEYFVDGIMKRLINLSDAD